MSRFDVSAAARSLAARAGDSRETARENACDKARETARTERRHAGFCLTVGDPRFAGGRSWLQAKLEVGPVDDPLEREAERVAQQVMRGGAEPDGVRQVAPLAITRAAQPALPGGAGAWPAPAVVEAVLATPGQPLAASTRAFMEARFGHSFAAVRVHDDARAGEAAASIAARAFTVGAHVLFARAHYRPESEAGRGLLAHELAHVVQQTGGAPLLQRDAMQDDPDIAAILRAAARGQKAGSDRTQLTLAGAEIAYRLLKRFLSGASGVISGIGHNPKVTGVQAVRSPAGYYSIELGADFIQGITADNLFARQQALVDALRAAAGATPRQDYVFLMGADPKGGGNPFYTLAERYYRSHLPNAVMVTDKRNLRDTLEYISSNVKQPVGDLYIVTHANEDGTVSFGLDGKDKDNKLTVPELAAALQPKDKKDALPGVADKIDRFTRIRIKGCDLGRTQEMVELIDQAFGGLGTVSAPTHEQTFAYEPGPARAAVKEAYKQIDASHPMPPEVDPSLKGAALATARAQRNKALLKRRQEVNAEAKARLPELKLIADKAGTFEEFSGPMFQRPGTTLYKAGELTPQVTSMYPHLAEKRQAALVKGLVAMDRRPPAVAAANGTFQQRGQRLDRKAMLVEILIEPQTLAEARLHFGRDMATQSFSPTSLQPVQRDVEDEEEILTFTLDGTQRVPGEKKPQPNFMSFTSGPYPIDAKMLRLGKEALPNHYRYAWRVERKHARNGKTTATAFAERVITYLHHESLRASPEKGFSRPDTDTRFTATSRFSPPDDGGKPNKASPTP